MANRLGDSSICKSKDLRMLQGRRRATTGLMEKGKASFCEVDAVAAVWLWSAASLKQVQPWFDHLLGLGIPPNRQRPDSSVGHSVGAAHELLKLCDSPWLFCAMQQALQGQP